MKSQKKEAEWGTLLSNLSFLLDFVEDHLLVGSMLPEVVYPENFVSGLCFVEIIPDLANWCVLEVEYKANVVL